MCKIWDRNTVKDMSAAVTKYSSLKFILNKGKPFTSIEPGSGLNSLCLVPNSGMIFMANEAPKILVYYIPV